MTDFIDLNRQFHQITEKEIGDVEHLISLQQYGIGTSVGWPELLEYDRVILLAEAGSGKTREMRAQAKRLAKEGRFAFLIPLELLKDGFDWRLYRIRESSIHGWRIARTRLGSFSTPSTN